MNPNQPIQKQPLRILEIWQLLALLVASFVAYFWDFSFVRASGLFNRRTTGVTLWSLHLSQAGSFDGPGLRSNLRAFASSGGGCCLWALD